MNIQSNTTHERKTFVHLSEDELHAAIVVAVMKEANIKPGKHVSVKVSISTRNRADFADVTITENLDPPPEVMGDVA